MAEKILIVEDDAKIADFLASSLLRSGFSNRVSHNLNEALLAIERDLPSLMILDLGLPDGDGLDLIPRVRERFDFPIIVLSARHQESDKVNALNTGADDYLSKPFSFEELTARIRVCLRRMEKMSMRDHVYVCDDLKIDPAKGVVTLKGVEVHLSPIEHKLLMILVRHPGKIFTQKQLLTEVWGPEYVDDTHYLRIHMGRLRAKIEEQPAQPHYLLTDLGIGYRLLAPASA